MAIFDDFRSNYEELCSLAYEKKRDEYPPIAKRKRRLSGGGIYCRDRKALNELRKIDKSLYELNCEILRFFKVPGYEKQGCSTPLEKEKNRKIQRVKKHLVKKHLGR